MPNTPLDRPLSVKALTLSSFVLIVLETIRATNGIVHASDFGGISFVGLALSGRLVAIGGPIAATIGFLAIGLTWKQQRVGYAVVLAFSFAFFLTHLLDQFGHPGPSVSDIGHSSGTLLAWVTMLWALCSVVCITLASYLLRQTRAP